MTDDRADPTFRAPLRQEAEPPRDTSASILDALDMEGAGDIEIVFKRPVRHPRPAAFD